MGCLFHCMKWLYRRFTRRLTISWEEPFHEEPSVFICNHAGAMGPVHMMIDFPLAPKLHAWCNEAIMNRKTCPAYVRQDFWWEPGCALEPLYNVTIPYLAAAIVSPVLKSAPTIPVYHDARVMTTMRTSLRWLKAGEHLVIFPEQPAGHGSYDTSINTGWLNLCVMYYRATGKALPMYPVHIDCKNKHFHVSKPIVFDTSLSLEEQMHELAEKLGMGLRGETAK